MNERPRDINIWVEIAYLVENIYGNEERDIRMNELLKLDIYNNVPNGIIWDTILTIDKNNILALEKIIEWYIDILDDLKNAIIHINKLENIDPNNITLLRFKTIYFSFSEKKLDLEKAKKTFIKMLNISIQDCLYYGVFDCFYNDLDFIKAYVSKIIKHIDNDKENFNSGYYKSLKSELLEL